MHDARPRRTSRRWTTSPRAAPAASPRRQHSTYMYQLCDNRTLDNRRVRRRARQAGRASTSTRLPPLDPDRQPRSERSCPTSRASSACPRSATVYAGTNDTATAAVATGAFAPGRAGISIGTTSVLVDEVDEFRVDLEHQIFSMPRSVPRPLRRVRGERARRQGRSSTCCATSSTRTTSSATTARPIRSPALDAALARRAGRRGRRHVPAVAGRRDAPQGDGAMRGGFVNMSLETTRARPRPRRRSKASRTTSAGSCGRSRRSPGNRIDEIALVGGAARSQSVVPDPRRRRSTDP